MKNNKIIAGVDEVGRGCLAGPVVAAAVILNKKINLKLLVDSKKINFQNRLKIVEYIKSNSHFSIGMASVEEIYKINILKASLLSMKRAINKLKIKPSLILIDGPYTPEGINNCELIGQMHEYYYQKSMSGKCQICRVDKYDYDNYEKSCNWGKVKVKDLIEYSKSK